MDQLRAERQRLEATVQGMVQGVGFRMHAARTARRLGLSGWVANRADGAVSVVAEGDRASLDALEAALRDGPRGASVARLDVQRGPARGGLAAFEVRHGSHTGD